ncbi:hypothetical protein HF521_016249 [Silurus meridionalis]|uniref:Otospiralin n=1 Tax=Silurus meridionalis TaxID=175797 RepID=A0A8T0BQL8_SILME|nr:hypothetical protein HF521_016249 [Silurus meridionalis]
MYEVHPLFYRWNYSMSHQRVLMLLCTVILLPLSIADLHNAPFLSSNIDIVSKSDHQETYIMPYWNMWSSDFFGWMEELRAQGAYDTLVDLARTYWAHFPLTSYLGYGLHPEQSEDTNN